RQVYRLSFAPRSGRQVCRESGERLQALEGVHAADISRADPHQGEELAHLAGELHHMPRRPGGRPERSRRIRGWLEPLRALPCERGAWTAALNSNGTRLTYVML